MFTTQSGEKVGQHIAIDDLPRALVVSWPLSSCIKSPYIHDTPDQSIMHLMKFYEHTFTSGDRTGQMWLYLVIADVDDKRKSSSVRIFEVCQLKDKGNKDKDDIKFENWPKKKLIQEWERKFAWQQQMGNSATV